MWTCKNCREAVEPQFSACWNCGATRDGQFDLHFRPEPAIQLHEPSRQPDLDVVDPDTKEWIDARASWLVGEFGRRRFLECVIVLPTAEFFPGDYSRTEDGPRRLLDQVCYYMQIDPARVELALYANNRDLVGDAPVGTFQPWEDRYLISVEASQLADPLAAAATMAHELGHVHLLGDGRISPDADDHEPLTDLLTVFMGLGVITANNAFSDSNWQGAGMEGWRISRQGYFTMPMFGYALAVFAELRGEEWPDWSKHLRLDVRHAFKRSLKYLQEYGSPDLRRVRTTTARPALAGAAPAVGEDEDELPIEDELDDFGCTYCGAPLVGSNAADGVCRECQESIAENDQEIEFEMRETKEATARVAWVLKWVLFASATAALALLGWRTLRELL